MRKTAVTLSPLAIAIALAAACGGAGVDPLTGDGTGSKTKHRDASTSGDDDSGSAVTGDDAGSPGDDAGSPGDDSGINMTGRGAGTGAPTGLPCDVQQLLENRCISCHQGPSPPSLLTYDDLVKPSSIAGTTLAQESLARMMSTTSPMPPPPADAPTANEVATFQAWVNAGTPMGAVCTPPVGGTADGGAGDASVDAGNPYATPTVCTSGQTWTGGNDGSSRMRPGGACITCHQMRGGPSFSIGGTVYPTAHEPNDCNGVPGGLTVVVTDNNGAVTSLTVNSAGNFYSKASIAAPFHVKVTDGTKERAMSTALTAGDCNSCHTETGANGAPGRIMAP